MHTDSYPDYVGFELVKFIKFSFNGFKKKSKLENFDKYKIKKLRALVETELVDKSSSNSNYKLLKLI